MPFQTLFEVSEMAEADGLLYGSDYSYTPGQIVEDLSQVMDFRLKEIFSEVQLQKIFSGNAESLDLSNPRSRSAA
jgi:hypothetical protein